MQGDSQGARLGLTSFSEVLPTYGSIGSQADFSLRELRRQINADTLNYL
jgi:hypothetical protein